MPDYLTVYEAAEALGYHPEYVRRMVRDGRLQADKKMRVWLIHRASIDHYRELVAGKSKNDPTRGS